jgi:hypothetical protein
VANAQGTPKATPLLEKQLRFSTRLNIVGRHRREVAERQGYPQVVHFLVNLEVLVLIHALC